MIVFICFILFILLMLALSWILTCGVIWLIALCFGLTFNWAIATRYMVNFMFNRQTVLT